MGEVREERLLRVGKVGCIRPVDLALEGERKSTREEEKYEKGGAPLAVGGPSWRGAWNAYPPNPPLLVFNKGRLVSNGHVSFR